MLLTLSRDAGTGFFISPQDCADAAPGNAATQ
ncbi:hypothetical protein CBM2606_A140348 [Cupriavidus taiwanensis]|nr:hypothetical protein CBM2606_A140348 [Cupriavidus taiwanensis]